MVKLTQDALTLQSTSTRYKLSLLAISPLAFAHVIYRTLNDGGMRYFKQRLGFGYKHFKNKPIHFHCASVGEFITAKPLILSIQSSHPDKKILITSNTPTAANLVDKLNHQHIYHHYLPLDFTILVNKFLKRTKPLCCFILETEIWPTFYSQAKKNNIDITIINARLSEKTLGASNFIRNEYARALKNVFQILTRTKDDHKNLLELG
ncbi:MAG: glycosyltransferase N-terminal domain-containing protein, partial [Pseudomonadota bacterium]